MPVEAEIWMSMRTMVSTSFSSLLNLQNCAKLVVKTKMASGIQGWRREFLHTSLLFNICNLLMNLGLGICHGSRIWCTSSKMDRLLADWRETDEFTMHCEYWGESHLVFVLIYPPLTAFLCGCAPHSTCKEHSCWLSVVGKPKINLPQKCSRSWSLHCPVG